MVCSQPLIGAFLCIFNRYVGCFLPLRGHGVCVFLKLTWVLLALTGASVCVSLTLTWVFFIPYVGECLCIFNPYVGCFEPLRGRVLVNL